MPWQEVGEKCAYVFKDSRKLAGLAEQDAKMSTSGKESDQLRSIRFIIQKSCASDPAITLLPYKSLITLNTSPKTR